MNEINRSIHILSIGISVIGFTACNGGSNYIPVSSATQEESAITDIPDSSDEKTNSNVIPTDSSFTVAFNETKSGVKFISNSMMQQVLMQYLIQDARVY